MTSDNEWFIMDDGEEPLTEEQEEALRKAYMNFIKNFMDYVRNVDPQLFKQAKEYSMDYSGNDRIKFFDRDKEGDE